MVRRCLSALLILVNGLLFGVNGNDLYAQGVVEHAVILQYHHVAEDTAAATSVSPKAFRGHMQLLQEGGFTVWPLSKLLQALQSKQKVPDKTVAITIDDAYLDVYQNAAPILKQFDYPFTVFVSTDPVDQRLPGFLSWDQLRQLKAQGAQLANHSRTHLHMLRKIEGEHKLDWLSRLRSDLDYAEMRLQQETGEHWKYFAYPYGEADELLQKVIKDWGYIGFGQQSGAVDEALLFSGLSPRFPINESYVEEKTFLLKASSLPLPVLKVVSDPVVWSHAGTPEMRLTLAKEYEGSLSCFASGQGQIRVQTAPDNVFIIKAEKTIPIGRSRYNCTMPVAGEAGRFHWYSKTWIRKRDDGGWYLE